MILEPVTALEVAASANGTLEASEVVRAWHCEDGNCFRLLLTRKEDTDR